MSQSLIIDVGMHTGRDTDFYLKKGFDVVAVEANPKLVEKAKSDFEKAISKNKLVIYDLAIADHEGEVDFYLNEEKDDWSTISKDFATRNEALGAQNTLTRVRCTTFQEILRKHEVPYYIKIDIEGADMLCLDALADFDEKPKYVSLEAAVESFEDVFNEISVLWGLGYRQFKVVNQAHNRRVRCPNPPREGAYTDFRFDGTCSGPFGEEAPGDWMCIEKTLSRLRRIVTEQKYFSASGKLYKTVLHRVYEALTGEKVGWYDIHARFGPRQGDIEPTL